MIRTPLAWRNLLHEGPRTLVAVAGVAFAVILILFLIALLRCQQADIPKVMEALAAVLKALTRWRS